MSLQDFPPWLLRSFAVVLGLLWGSFLNVVIYRVPKGMSVVRPASHCPGCGAPIRAYDNVPVLSYLWLRGRARCCGVRMSPRYPLVEAIGGVIAWAIFDVCVLGLPPDTPIGRAGAVFVADLALALGLVAAAFIDLEHMYLPDAITLGGTVLGVATSWLRPPVTLVDSLIGAAVGFAIVWLPFSVLYRLVRGRTGMGLGDAKLVMLAGAWFGWAGAVFALLAGAVQGTLVALVLFVTKGKIEEPAAIRAEKEQIARELEAMSPERRARAEEELQADPIHEELGPGFAQARLPFGPLLVLSILEYMFLEKSVLLPWLSWLGFSE
jgi:leader peptidase (prepilin peptidase)/N-methyltransferase